MGITLQLFNLSLMPAFGLINAMLIDFLQSTQRYHRTIIGLIIVSMILIMSQVSIHSLMYQQKINPQTYSNTDILSSSDKAHCISQIASDSQQQCQSFLSLADSFSSSCSIVEPLFDYSAITLFISFADITLNQPNYYQLSVYNFILKNFSPSILIKLHSFLI